MDYHDNLLPPPFVIKETSPSETQFGGDIKLTQDGKLLMRFISFQGFNRDIIENYNDAFIHRIPLRLVARPKTFANGLKIWFDPSLSNNKEFFHLHFPVKSNGQPLYPREARELHTSYSGKMRIDLAYDKGNERGVIPNIDFGDMPIMLGSKWDWLTTMTPEQRLEHGECNYDPLGYFIVKGIEYIVVPDEGLRYNRFQINLEKQTQSSSNETSSLCKMTCNTNQGTIMVSLTHHLSSEGKMENKNIIRGFFQYFDPKTRYNILLIFYFILSRPESPMVKKDFVEMVYHRYIEPFIIKQERRKKCFLQFQATINDFYSITNDFEKVKPQRLNDKTQEVIREELLKFLFPQISKDFSEDNTNVNQDNENIYFHRVSSMLGMMIAHYLEYISNFISIIDRDSWSNKRVSTAGNVMEMMIIKLWNKLLKKAEKTIMKVADSRQMTKQIIEASFDGSNIDITDKLVRSFTDHRPESKRDIDNPADLLQRDTIVLVYSQMTRIATPINKKDKKIGIRLYKPSGDGFICPVDTPEGASCGLKKHKAVTCWITKYLPDFPILRYIQQDNNFSYLYDPNTPYDTPLLINGKFIGWFNGDKVHSLLLQFRRTSQEEGMYNRNMSIVRPGDGKIYVDTGGEILMRPLLIVDDHGDLVIDKINGWSLSFDELLKRGALEYIDPWEQEYAYVAQMVKYVRQRKEEFINLPLLLTEKQSEYQETQDKGIRKMLQEEITNIKLSIEKSRRKYTHCEMDPTALFGISASLIPFANYNYAVKDVHACSHAPRALTIPHMAYRDRWDTTSRILAYPTQSLMKTQLAQAIGLDENPNGVMVIVALMALDFNQEDSIILKRSAVDRGLFWTVLYHSHLILSETNDTYFVNPINEEDNVIQRMKNDAKGGNESAINLLDKFSKNRDVYRNLNSQGFPMKDTNMLKDDCLVGMIRVIIRRAGKSGEGVIYIDVSKYIKLGEEGIVDRAVYYPLITGIAKGIRVKIRQVRPIRVGDKLASRHAQKATIGKIRNEEDLPFTRDGIVPDIIINPHCIASRMTIAKLMEIAGSKVGALKAEKINATAFNQFDINQWLSILPEYGYNSYGEEMMTDGRTGKEIPTQIFIGPCYYQVLSHFVGEKYQSRGPSGGPVQQLTRQPRGGRQEHGAMRLGEMERDAIISHGAAYFLQERTCLSSDPFKTVFCINCQNMARVHPETKSLVCSTCGEKAVFGKCTIPYAMKLLMQMVSIIGIKITPIIRLTSEPPGLRKTISEQMKKEEETEEEETEEEETEEEIEKGEELEKTLGENESQEDEEEFEEEIEEDEGEELEDNEGEE